MSESPRERKMVEVFRRAGGVLRTTQALQAGVHRRDLYALRDAGILRRVSRGVYRLAGYHPPLAEPDLVTVAARVPKAVIALVSALHFHGLTTEIPHEVSIALPRGTVQPRLDWPPLRVYRFSGTMFSSGIEMHERDAVKVRVYGAAKTVADCFRFRNRSGPMSRSRPCATASGNTNSHPPRSCAWRRSVVWIGSFAPTWRRCCEPASRRRPRPFDTRSTSGTRRTRLAGSSPSCSSSSRSSVSCIVWGGPSIATASSSRGAAPPPLARRRHPADARH